MLPRGGSLGSSVAQLGLRTYAYYAIPDGFHPAWHQSSKTRNTAVLMKGILNMHSFGTNLPCENACTTNTEYIFLLLTCTYTYV